MCAYLHNITTAVQATKLSSADDRPRVRHALEAETYLSVIQDSPAGTHDNPCFVKILLHSAGMTALCKPSFCLILQLLDTFSFFSADNMPSSLRYAQVKLVKYTRHFLSVDNIFIPFVCITLADNCIFSRLYLYTNTYIHVSNFEMDIITVYISSKKWNNKINSRKKKH